MDRRAHEAMARYREAQISGASPLVRLVLMLDEGLASLDRARTALASGDRAEAGHAIGRAQIIVTELAATLDHDLGGALAGRLAALYEFLLHHLTLANAHADVVRIDEAHRVLTIVAEAFRTLAEGEPR